MAAVAKDTWNAFQARKRLQIDGDLGEHAQASSTSIRERFQKQLDAPPDGQAVAAGDSGDAEAALADAATTVEAVYETPC